MIRSQSTRGTRRTRIGTALAVTLAAGVFLTGCSAGQITQTSQQRPALQGISATSGEVSVLDAYIVAPPTSDELGAYESGDTTDVRMVLVNEALTEDEVTKIEIGGEDAEIKAEDGDSIVVPARGKAVVGPGGEATVTIEIQDQMYPAQYVAAVVTFKNGGPVEFNIPVAASLKELPQDPDQNFDLHHGDGSGEGGH